MNEPRCVVCGKAAGLNVQIVLKHDSEIEKMVKIVRPVCNGAHDGLVRQIEMDSYHENMKIHKLISVLIGDNEK